MKENYLFNALSSDYGESPVLSLSFYYYMNSLKLNDSLIISEFSYSVFGYRSAVIKRSFSPLDLGLLKTIASSLPLGVYTHRVMR